MGRVVQGGPMLFREDLPLLPAEAGTPLGLPRLPLAPEPFTVVYNNRLLALRRVASPHHATIWGHRNGLVEETTAKAVETAYLAEHAGLIAAATAAWLQRVLPGIALEAAREQWGHTLADTLREAVAAAYAPASRPPRPMAGKGALAPRQEGALLERLQGFDRVLLLDGKLYDLLTLPEYLERFARGIEEAFFSVLQERARDGTPQEIAALMTGSRDRMGPSTYAAAKGQLYHDERTFALYLDGTHFVPEHAGRASELLDAVDLQLEQSVKLDAANAAGT